MASGQRLIVEGKMAQRSAQPIYWTHWPTVWPRLPAADAPGREEDAAATSFNVSVGIVGLIKGSTTASFTSRARDIAEAKR